MEDNYDMEQKKQAPRLEEPIPQEQPRQDTPEQPLQRVTVCDVQFRSGSKIYYFDPGDLEVKTGDHLILDTSRGAEYGLCVGGSHRVPQRELVMPLRRVLRFATAQDEKTRQDNARREKEAYAFCQRKIEELEMDMQLVSTECAFDGSKLLFFFTADARVDFRELVRILAANFHTRIELRQIGVRDKAKMLGGLGICGRPFCCASFLEDFEPVSIKMAKTQNLSLNPAKISGTCGRLMCCLKYEQEAYEDLLKTSPKAESFVDTPDGRGTVTAVNLMRQSVNVRMEKDPEEIHCYRNCDICVLRSGKGKPTDPPIPEDLAPISGGQSQRLGDRVSQPDPWLTAEPEEAAPEEGSVPGENRPSRRQRRGGKSGPKQSGQGEADQKQAQAEGKEQKKQADRPAKPAQTQKQPTQQEKSGKPRHRRHEKHEKHDQKPPMQTPMESKPPRQEKHPAAEKQIKDAVSDQAKAEGAKKNNRRRYYHHRRPKTGGQG